MTQVVVGIGSNLDREVNIAFALRELSRWRTLTISPIVESDPVGYRSNSRFHNLVAGFETNGPPSEIKRRIKQLEYQAGRRPDESRFSPKALDIDILLWGDEIVTTSAAINVPHPDILQYSHVLCPLALLYPDWRHPVTHETYQMAWQARREQLPPVVILPAV